jgi:predicted transcriptional regulator
LDELRNQGKLSRDELEEQIDASRTTIQRNLDELVDRDWINGHGQEYSINPCGDLIIRGFDDLLETMEVADHLQPFFKWFPKSELEFEIDALADADVTVSAAGDPYAPVNAHAESLATADRFHAFLPSVSLHPLKIAHRKAMEDTPDQKIIVSKRVSDTIKSNTDYREIVEEMSSNEETAFLVTKDDVSFYLGILDEKVQIGVEDGEGLPRALLETKSEAVRRWARKKLQKHGKEAETLSLV